jgi:glycosyltransferase involved in cell wall biosynthesis
MQLSVVVPAYREGARIYDNLQRLVAELDQLNTDYEVLVVSDGNTDRTVDEAERVPSARVKVLQYAVNRGKGFALSYGVGHATGELVTFIDADMELNPREIKRFIELLHAQDADIIIGSKRHPQSRVHYPTFRRLQSFVYQVLIRLLFDVGVRDTQTGLKLFRRQVLAEIVPLLAVKQFAFDLELLVVARHLGYTRIREAPIELSYQFASTISPRAVFKILWDTAAIFYRLHITHYYDHRRRELRNEAAVAGGPPPAGEPAAPADAVRQA